MVVAYETKYLKPSIDDSVLTVIIFYSAVTFLPGPSKRQAIVGDIFWHSHFDLMTSYALQESEKSQ